MDAREKRAWWLVAIMFVEMFFVHGAFIILPVYMIPIERAFGWNRLRSSTLQTFAGFSMGAIGMPLVGWLIDFLDAQIVMSAGVVVLSAGFILAALAHSYAALAVSYFLIGLGDAAATLSPCAEVVSNWFEPRRRGLALGLALAGMSVGGMVLYIVVNRVIYSWGWRASYAVVPLPIIVLILPLVIWKVRTRPLQSAVAGSAASILPGAELGEAMRGRAFWLIAVCQFTFNLTLAATTAHTIPYITGAGYGRTVAVRAFGIATGLAGVGKVIMGWLADRISGRTALALDLFGNAIGVSMLLFVGYEIVLVGWTVVWGLTIIAPLSLIPLVITECYGLKRLGSLIGLLYMFSALGGALGPVSMGWLYVHTQTYRYGFEILATLLIFAAICALGCKPRHPEVPVAARAHTGAAVGVG